MLDVLVVGAGPAGAVAATVLARAGVRVRIVDRATFPRDKLCGDTINPGTLALLRRLRMAPMLEDAGLPVEGMRVTAGNGVTVTGRYPDGAQGCAILRRDFDWLVLQDALAAGADFDPGTHVRTATIDSTVVTGVSAVGRGGFPKTIPARVTIAADGRRSTLAFGLGLSHHPRSPRRWAIGGYFERAATPDAGTIGEMHIRARRYIGVAPVPGGLTNVCLVKSFGAPDPRLRDPAALLRGELGGDPILADRFANAHLVGRPAVLGPLAVDVEPSDRDGLLLAGDAAGFIDPMTGDGLRFAVRGGELAALAALDALQHGWTGVRRRLMLARRAEFAAKWRFNAALRALVASPAAVSAAAAGVRLAPAMLRRAVQYAGDCA
jgi:flavin-dependent dehydrogenase